MNPMMGVMGGGGAPSTGNVMQITSTLRGMSDQQLQQYAAMHKSDPFVFPLAFQESQTRQQMRAGSLAQRAGQKPPPVVDQDLQQMTPTPITGGAGQAITGGHGQAINALPEEQGIGALNAPNLQRMADGGIAGYADGGPQQPGMFNYAQMAPAVDLHPNSGMTPRSMAGGGITGYADAVATAPIRATNPGGPGGMQYYLDVPDDPSERVMFKTLRGKLFGNEKVPPELGKLKGQLFKTQEEAQTAYNDALGKKSTATATPATPPAAETPAVESKESPKAEDVLAEPAAPKTPWSPGITAPTLQASGVALGRAPTAANAKEQANMFYNPNDIKNMLAEDVTETGVQNVQNAEALRKLMENRPTLGKKQEERLAAEEAKEPELKEQNKDMALLQAGLAVLGGDSPYAFKNLSRAAVGVEAYKEGLKDIKKAHDLRQQALDHIDDMRDAQSIGDQNLAYTEKQKAGDKMLAARHAATSGFASALGVSGQIGERIFDNENNNYAANQRTNAEVGSRTALGNAQLQMEANKLNMPPAEARMAMILGGPTGDLETGLKKLAEIQSGKVNPLQSFLDYQKTNAGKQTPYGEPVKLMDAPEYFAMFDKALKLYKTSLGPSAPTNKAPSNLRE